MKIKLFIVLITMVLILSACVQGSFQGTTGSEEIIERPSVEEIPEEPAKEELIRSLESGSGQDVPAMIGNAFHLLEVLNGEVEEAYIYATRRFNAEELAGLVADLNTPEEISEFRDGRQILIYDDYFVTFIQAEEDADATLIEVASDEFVENNYSPNYFGGFFTFLLLNRMLGTSGWEKRRINQCRNNTCYGGYYSGNQNSQRGISGYRGGGPGAGK